MKRIIALTLAATAVSVASANPVTDAGTLSDLLVASGYTEVRDMELDDGLWEVDVLGEDGRWHDLHVVPETGEILDSRSGTPLLTAAETIAALELEGYTNLRDLDLDDALWEVEATAPDGTKVDLRVNAFDGSVLYTETDD